MTYEEILAYLESLKGTPVDLQAAMQGNPNETTPVAKGGTDVAWGNVPGLEQFYSYDIPSNSSNFNLQAALPEIQRLGYQVMQAEDPGAETMASWVAGQDGKPIAQSAHLTGTNDDKFRLAALAAMGVTGANVLGAGFGASGAVAPGAAESSLLQLGTLPPVPPPLSPLAMTGTAAMPFLEALPAAGGILSAAAPAVASGLLNGIDPTLLQLGGAALGAASSQDQEQTTTQKNEPWAPAQQWIKDNIASGQALQKQYTEQPFSPGQQTAYGNMYGLLNSYNREMLPGLLSNANAMMTQGYDRYAPKETRAKPKFGAVNSTWNPGLLTFGG